MGTHHVKVRYLDASAIVKIFIDEDGSAPVRDLYYSSSGFCATSLCLTEALGAIKGKWRRKEIDDERYFDSTKRLLVDAWSETLKIDEIPLLSIPGIRLVEEAAKRHSLDWSDALQLVTILRGTYSHFAGESRTVFVSADKKLVKAARWEGIRTWWCNKEPTPEWA